MKSFIEPRDFSQNPRAYKTSISKLSLLVKLLNQSQQLLWETEETVILYDWKKEVNSTYPRVLCRGNNKKPKERTKKRNKQTRKEANDHTSL